MQGFSQKYSPRCNRNSRTFCYMSLTVFRNARLRNFMEAVDNPEQSPQETRSGADRMAPLYSLVDSYAPARCLCASWFPRRPIYWAAQAPQVLQALWRLGGCVGTKKSRGR